jgi:hypothetical protein
MLTIKLTYGPRNTFNGMTFNTLAEAQKAYVDARDDSDLGASQFGFGNVFKNGEHIAAISYNGRVWTPDEKTPITDLSI